jgi:hypothetical protein
MCTEARVALDTAVPLGEILTDLGMRVEILRKPVHIRFNENNENMPLPFVSVFDIIKLKSLRNNCYAMHTFPTLFFPPSIGCYFRVQNLYNTQVSRSAEPDTLHAFHNIMCV